MINTPGKKSFSTHWFAAWSLKHFFVKHFFVFVFVAEKNTTLTNGQGTTTSTGLLIGRWLVGKSFNIVGMEFLIGRRTLNKNPYSCSDKQLFRNKTRDDSNKMLQWKLKKTAFFCFKVFFSCKTFKTC